jgi:hypothetical protein
VQNLNLVPLSRRLPAHGRLLRFADRQERCLTFSGSALPFGSEGMSSALP